jgi:hypothetical protein
MVAAWIRADTGVGPAMASGSQVWRMNWPDFDITAVMRHSDATSRRRWSIWPVLASVLIRRMSKLPTRPRASSPAAKYRMIMPTSRPTSPTRLVRKALRAALEFGFSSHQWPISANEQSPTSSQPTISWRVFWLSTNPSIEAVKRLRKA